MKIMITKKKNDTYDKCPWCKKKTNGSIVFHCGGNMKGHYHCTSCKTSWIEKEPKVIEVEIIKENCGFCI